MEKLCANCKKNTTKRRFCSRYCSLIFYNNHSASKPITKIDKMGRSYLSCSKCGNRLKHVVGMAKFICSKCIKASDHQSNQNSVFMKKVFKKGAKIKELILEITQYNRNWHYLNGRPVQGFDKARRSFTARAHTLVHRENFKEIS